MNVKKKNFIGNHTLQLGLSVTAQLGQLGCFETPQFVIGGLVVCQFRAELNIKQMNTTYEYRIITLSEKFTLVENDMKITPVISSQSNSQGSNAYDVKRDDTIIVINNIWHHKGTSNAIRCTSEYVIDLNISIKDWSLRASPFNILHDDTTITDFELSGHDGSIIVHKAVLAASSPMLNTMLSGQWKEATNGKLELAGITKETLTDLKAFMYLKKLPSISDNEEVDKDERHKQMLARLEELLKLACYLLMSDLVEACSALLLLHLTTDNAYKLVNLAGMYKIKILSQGLFFSYQQRSMDFTWSSIFPGDWI